MKHYIRSRSLEAFPDETGTIGIHFEIASYEDVMRLGATCIRIYRDTGTLIYTLWNTEHVFKDMVASDVHEHSLSLKVHVDPGRYYVLINFYAKNRDGSESVLVRSEPVEIE